MLGELRRLIAQRPFIPFVIHMAEGQGVRVPTVDHIAIAPNGARVVVFNDEGTTDFLSVLLISRITLDAAPSETVTL